VIAAPLSALVHAKTAGNPFFALQFLHALADEGLLAFDYPAQRWSPSVEGPRRADGGVGRGRNTNTFT